MLNLQNFYDIYRTFITHNGVQYSLYAAKCVAIILALITYFQNYFKAYKVEGHNSGFTFYDLFRPLILCTMIATYSTFIDYVDQGATIAETYFTTNLKNETTVVQGIQSNEKKPTPPPEGKPKQGMIDRVASATSSISDFLSYPGVILRKIAIWFANFIDSLMYGFIIIVRFAFLFILRFLGPFAIAASIHNRFQGAFWAWLKAYGMMYLWIFAIFLINLFAALVANAIYQLKYSVDLSTGNEVMDLGNNVAGNYYWSTVYCSTVSLMVLVKLYLYFKSKKILEQIFVSQK